MDKGFVIIAQNTDLVNYVQCAEQLAESIMRVMPNAKVSLISDNETTCNAFDQVIKLPYGDQAPDSDWKLINDWQVYEASPYEYTIKLEADMYIPTSIDYWWGVLKERDMVISTTIRDFKQNISHTRAYRRFIDDNKLPDTYNAITYFKKSETAKKFFETVRHVFENWSEFRDTLQCNADEPATTDWVYAYVSHLMGKEHTTLPVFTDMSMIHMKQFINTMPTENWIDTLIYEIHPHTLRIHTQPQMYPFHYHIKSFSAIIEESFSE